MIALFGMVVVAMTTMVNGWTINDMRIDRKTNEDAGRVVLLRREENLTSVAFSHEAHEEHERHADHEEHKVPSSSVATPSPTTVTFRGKDPHFSDLAQGSLGDCYFLAACAALALKEPQAIRDAFIKHDKTDTNNRVVVEVRFYWPGAAAGHVDVAVDEVMPADYTGRPLFVKWADGKDMWPLLLEKAWAKFHGSYVRTEGGKSYSAYHALTNKPSTALKRATRVVCEFEQGDLLGVLYNDEGVLKAQFVEGGVNWDDKCTRQVFSGLGNKYRDLIAEEKATDSFAVNIHQINDGGRWVIEHVATISDIGPNQSPHSTTFEKAWMTDRVDEQGKAKVLCEIIFQDTSTFTTDQLWTKMLDNRDKPMTASARKLGKMAKTSEGVIRKHAFAVMKVEAPPAGLFDATPGLVHPDRAVLVYNPHGSDKSDDAKEELGFIKHVTTGEFTDIEGVFWMPFEAYYNSFHETYIHGEGTLTTIRDASVGRNANKTNIWTDDYQANGRLQQLNNFNGIKTTGNDVLFPPDSRSVCGPGDEKWSEECKPNGGWTTKELTITYTPQDGEKNELGFTFDADSGVVKEVNVDGKASGLVDFKFHEGQLAALQPNLEARNKRVNDKEEEIKTLLLTARTDLETSKKGRADVQAQIVTRKAAIVTLTQELAQEGERASEHNRGVLANWESNYEIVVGNLGIYDGNIKREEERIVSLQAFVDENGFKNVVKFQQTNTAAGGGAVIKVASVNGRAFAAFARQWKDMPDKARMVLEGLMNRDFKKQNTPGAPAPGGVIKFENQPIQFLDFANLKDSTNRHQMGIGSL